MKSNNKLKDQLITKLKSELKNPAATSEKRDWNPAGNNLSVSARYVNFKDARSNYQLTNTLNEQAFKKNSDIYNQKLKNSKKVRTKMRTMATVDKNYRMKMGYLNRSKVLYEKHRMKEAFETIIKAIAIVKKEDEEFEDDHNDFKRKLRKKLDLSFDADLDENVLLRLQQDIKKPKVKEEDGEAVHRANDRHRSLDDFDGIKFQKLVYYAEKTGIIGDQPANVDQDLKDEIEEV